MTNDEASAGFHETRERDIASVRRNIASRLAYLHLYQAAGRGMVDRDAEPLVKALIDDEQEIIRRLASQLRQLGQPVPLEADDERLLYQFKARRGTRDRLAFLRQGLVTAEGWYRAQAGDAGHSPTVRALFAELAEEQLRRIGQVDALLARLDQKR